MYVQVQRTVNRLNRVWESRRLHLEKQLKPKDADSRCRQVGHTQHIVVTGASEIGRMAPESMENFWSRWVVVTQCRRMSIIGTDRNVGAKRIESLLRQRQRLNSYMNK